MNGNPNEIVKELDVLDILSTRPCGMTLPEIGNEMGVNWRGLAATVSALISEGSIEKLGNRYYLAGNKNDFDISTSSPSQSPP